MRSSYLYLMLAAVGAAIADNRLIHVESMDIGIDRESGVLRTINAKISIPSEELDFACEKSNEKPDDLALTTFCAPISPRIHPQREMYFRVLSSLGALSDIGGTTPTQSLSSINMEVHFDETTTQSNPGRSFGGVANINADYLGRFTENPLNEDENMIWYKSPPGEAGFASLAEAQDGD